MADLRPLQEGRLRRSQLRSRRRRARRARGLALLALVVVGAAVLVGLDLGGHRDGTAKASKRTTPATLPDKSKPAKPTDVPKPKPKSQPRNTYARVADGVQIHPHLMVPIRSGLLFDVRSGRVLWSKAPSRELPIASLTKMMTALVVASDSKPTDQVKVTRAAVDFTGSGVGLLPLGKRVPEIALLYGLLLPSGNDAAIALAQHVAGTQARFIGLMNERARQMGLTCTHFTTVSGVVDRGNHSCATDLAVLAHAVLTNRTLARIVATPTAVLRFPIKGGKLFLTNNNPLLRADFAGTDGVKTGYTTAAGLCIVATAKRRGHWLGLVLLHTTDWQWQAEELLNSGFRALQMVKPPTGLPKPDRATLRRP